MYFFEDLILLPHLQFRTRHVLSKVKLFVRFDVSLTVSPSWVTATCPENEDWYLKAVVCYAAVFRIY